MIYEGMRTWFTLDGQTDPGPLAKLASGASSGAIAQSITYPLLSSPHLKFYSTQLTYSIVTSSAEDFKSTPWLVWDSSTHPWLAP
jgi:hypothetical protein